MHVQAVEQVVVAPQGMPRSQSHANLRQGLDRISAESQADADSSAPAVATAGPSMRRSKSKLGLETLASVESMNCPIIDYSQLEIKRKIGDGSVGQVYDIPPAVVCSHCWTDMPFGIGVLSKTTTVTAKPSLSGSKY